MAITDQQFEDWLRAPKKYAGQSIKRTILAEAKYYPSGGPEATAYFSTRPFTSQAADTPANQDYDPIIVAAPTFMQRLSEVERIWEHAGGRASSGWGDLIIDNTAGARDAWLNHGWDGRALTLLLGDRSWPRSDFRTILVGQSADIVAPSRSRLALRIRDKLWATNVPLQTNRIGGTTDNKDKLVPLCYSTVFNAEPALNNNATHEYHIHDGPVTGGSSGAFPVRENGAPLYKGEGPLFGLSISALDAGTDTLTTNTDHGASVDSRVRFLSSAPTDFIVGVFYWVISSGLTATQFKLSLTRGGSPVNITGGSTGQDIGVYNWWADPATGKLYLVAAPSGRITAAILGAAPGVSGLTVSSVDAGADLITFSAAHGASAQDRIVFAGTVPAGITAGADYYVSATGLTGTAMKVSVTQYGPVVDITDTTTGATATRYSSLKKCADIISHVVQTRTALTSADLDSTSFSDFNTTCPQNLAFFSNEFMSVGTAIDMLVASVGGLWTFGLDGKMFLGRFDAPSGSPAMEILEDEVARNSFKVAARILPIKKYTLGYQKNYSPQSDGLAGSLTEADMTSLALPFRIKTAANAVTTMHPLAPETPEVPSLLTNATECQTEVDRRATLWNTLRYIYELRVFAAPYKLRLGQVIKITHTRFGFSAGKLVTIIGMHWAPTRAGGVLLEVFA